MSLPNQLRRHSPRRTRIRLLTHTTSHHRSSGLTLSFLRRRAKRTELVGVDADGFVVFAEDDARDVVGGVFGADVGVQGHVRGALEVVGVLVEAHFAWACWVEDVDGVGTY